ncbi:MAG: hypothetical protein ABIG28_02735 [archaeon]
MSKIGNYEFPDTRFRTILKAIEVLVTTLKGKVEQEENFAKAMKQSQSGGFIQKLSDLRKYGLIGKRGGIEATELAKKIVKPYTEQEKKEALNETIRNVKLWVDLYNGIGEEEVTEEQFKIHLSELTNDRDKIDKLNSAIFNSYNEIKKYLLSEQGEKSEKYLSDDIDNNTVAKNSGNNPQSRKQKTNLPETMINANIEDVYIEMPRTLESVEIAKQMINILETKIKSSKKEADKEED